MTHARGFFPAPRHSLAAFGRAGGSAARARGFTLVEVLVALSIFALLAAAGVGVMAYSADQQMALRARLDALGRLQHTQTLLQADLSQVALRRTRRADGGSERAAFNAAPPGDLQRPLLAFVRRGWENPDAAPRASLQYVEYRLVDGRLERSTRPALDGTVAQAPQVLLDGVEQVRSHFHSRGHWSDGWGGGVNELPRALKLQLQTRDFGAVELLFLLPENGT